MIHTYIPMGKSITLLCLLLNSFRTLWSFRYTAIVLYHIPGYNFPITVDHAICLLVVTARKLLRGGWTQSCGMLEEVGHSRVTC